MYFRPQTWINIVACGVAIYAILTVLTMLSIQKRFVAGSPRGPSSNSGFLWFAGIYVVVIGSLNLWLLIDYISRFRRSRQQGYCSHCGRALSGATSRCDHCGTREHKQQQRGFRLIVR